MNETEISVNEADYLEGWEAMQDMLAADEEWARMQFEAFHGQDV